MLVFEPNTENVERKHMNPILSCAYLGELIGIVNQSNYSLLRTLHKQDKDPQLLIACQNNLNNLFSTCNRQFKNLCVCAIKKGEFTIKELLDHIREFKNRSPKTQTVIIDDIIEYVRDIFPDPTLLEVMFYDFRILAEELNITIIASVFKKANCLKNFRLLLKLVEPTINRNFLISC